MIACKFPPNHLYLRTLIVQCHTSREGRNTNFVRSIKIFKMSWSTGKTFVKSYVYSLWSIVQASVNAQASAIVCSKPLWIASFTAPAPATSAYATAPATTSKSFIHDQCMYVLCKAVYEIVCYPLWKNILPNLLPLYVVTPVNCFIYSTCYFSTCYCPNNHRFIQ